MNMPLNSHCSVPAPFTALAFTALIGLSSQALAISDTKGISGASCQPAMPADAAALAYGNAGVTNIGSTNHRVVCPLLTDAQNWSTQGVDIYIARGTVQCVLSIVHVDIDTTLTRPGSSTSRIRSYPATARATPSTSGSPPMQTAVPRNGRR